jgi:transglutaminase-like putative cysteine protease
MLTASMPLDAFALRRTLEETWIPAWAAHPYTRAVAGVALDEAGAPFAHDDDRGRALAIGRWVRARIRYAPEVGEIVESPGWVLRHRVADCDGMTWLTGALCASVGLRVRVALAYVLRRDRIVPIHIYPEIFDRAARVWMPVDPARPCELGTPAPAALEDAARRARGGILR